VVSGVVVGDWEWKVSVWEVEYHGVVEQARRLPGRLDALTHDRRFTRAVDVNQWNGNGKGGGERWEDVMLLQPSSSSSSSNQRSLLRWLQSSRPAVSLLL